MSDEDKTESAPENFAQSAQGLNQSLDAGTNTSATSRHDAAADRGGHATPAAPGADFQLPWVPEYKALAKRCMFLSDGAYRRYLVHLSQSNAPCASKPLELFDAYVGRK